MIEETIVYNQKKQVKKISSSTESLTFVFNKNKPPFPIEFMGLNITLPFLTEMEIRSFDTMVFTKDGVNEVFSSSYTNNFLTGLQSNLRTISFIYENGLIKYFTEIIGEVTKKSEYTRDSEGKLMDIKTYIGEEVIDMKDILYSENDTIIGYTDRLIANLFRFDVFGVYGFESDYVYYTVEYE